MDFSQSLRTRLRWLVRRSASRASRARCECCCWCLLREGGGRTQIVRRHSDMGLLGTASNTREDPNLSLSPNDIARLLWLNKLRMQTLEPPR